MKFRVTAPAVAAALLLGTLAHAYINPSAVGVADELAKEAAALHNHIHALYPSALSGATVHEYDNAADDLDDDLAAWSLGLLPESAIYPRLDTLDETWLRYSLTVRLEKLFQNDPVGRAMHRKCKSLHMTVSNMIVGMNQTNVPLKFP